jgi:Phytanoyl-CoA dioxygenase (PhyH)
MSSTCGRFQHRGEPSRWELVRNGFVVLNAFVDRTELEWIKVLVEAAVHLPHDPVCERPHNTLVPLRWNDSLVRRIVMSDHRVEVLRVVSASNDLRWISAYLSIKEPSSPPLWWHQDWWCWDHPVSFRPAAAQIALLCYLTDTSTRNGALRVVPGSHLESTAIHSILPEAHSQNETLPPGHLAVSDLAEQVTLELQAGDAVLLDFRLLHGTHANATAARRDCLILNFTPSWQALEDEIKAHLICHPALPSQNEAVTASMPIAKLLPSFAGERKSLPLNRNAPSEFRAVER